MKIAGVDEVGVGCLAGPVISSAIIFNSSALDVVFKDSKKTTAKQRAHFVNYMKRNCFIAIGVASPKEVDDLNVLKATHLAMKRAIYNLPCQPKKILIDGIYVPEGLDNAEAIVKGDQHSQQIAAASIFAKHFRDALMSALSLKYPHYHLEKNKGYPTKQHKEAINQFGLSNIHRKSFKI
jgi:ribonuclease HII